jgi:DNA-binding NarL/FixJ family response regulator
MWSTATPADSRTSTKAEAMSASSDLLLVEDDLMLARALQRSLTTRGIRARHVARCATAQALRGPFIVGVFDIDLPDGDGVELARLLMLRGIVSRVVFFTACSQPGRLSRARDLGPVFGKSGSVSMLMDGLAQRPNRDLALAALQCSD